MSLHIEVKRELSDYAKVIINSRPNRFPPKTWERIAEAIKEYDAGEITSAQLDGYLFRKADYYDNIKRSERWWNIDEFMPPYVFDIDSVENSHKHNKAIIRTEV